MQNSLIVKTSSQQRQLNVMEILADSSVICPLEQFKIEKRISSHLQWLVLSNHVQGVQGLAEAIHLKPEHYECFPCSIVRRNSNKTMMNIIKHCCTNLSDVV